ncbi:hypothetical protein [Stenotrophomonas indicatrix]|uniref:hypothetical protein n=1 Tax=Stenotrophomonas indicatrix TaxID=2045451 RepID=UPI001CC174A9|nr:hypothetical protein [Stenotrophomonas indicatrix]
MADEKGVLVSVWHWLRGRQWGAIAISLAAIAIVVVRVRYPNSIKLEAIDLAFVAIALLPWLRSVVKSVELAGVGRLELQDVDRVADSVADADLPLPDDGTTEGVESQVEEVVSQREDRRADDSHGKWAVDEDDPDSATFGGGGADRSFRSDWSYLKSYMKESAFDDLQYATSTLPDESKNHARIAGLKMLLKRSLRELCRANGIAPPVSASAIIGRLSRAKVFTKKQANAVHEALQLLDAALGSVGSSLAMARTIDIAHGVLESLNVMVEAANRAKMSPQESSIFKIRTSPRPTKVDSDRPKSSLGGPEPGEG